MTSVRVSRERRALLGRGTGSVGWLMGRGLLHLLTVFLSLVFMGPFLWSLFSSLKKPLELYIFPPTILPESPQWANYARVWEMAPYGRWLLNSVVVTGLAVAGTVLSSSIVAYSFARFRYPGREIFFLVMLSTIMLPREVTIIPSYLFFNYIEWSNTLKPLIVPAWLGGGAINIFLMRQFLLTIPRDLDEAALMDGASIMRIFFRILMPLSKPVLATVAVISFIGHWNSFMEPLIFLNSEEKFTLALGLRFFQGMAQMTAEPMEHLLMAAALMMTFPCIALFFAAQQYFVRGVVMSGIKG